MQEKIRKCTWPQTVVMPTYAILAFFTKHFFKYPRSENFLTISCLSRGGFFSTKKTNVSLLSGPSWKTKLTKWTIEKIWNFYEWMRKIEPAFIVIKISWSWYSAWALYGNVWLSYCLKVLKVWNTTMKKYGSKLLRKEGEVGQRVAKQDCHCVLYVLLRTEFVLLLFTECLFM